MLFQDGDGGYFSYFWFGIQICPFKRECYGFCWRSKVILGHRSWNYENGIHWMDSEWYLQIVLFRDHQKFRVKFVYHSKDNIKEHNIYIFTSIVVTVTGHSNLNYIIMNTCEGYSDYKMIRNTILIRSLLMWKCLVSHTDGPGFKTHPRHFLCSFLVNYYYSVFGRVQMSWEVIRGLTVKAS